MQFLHPCFKSHLFIQQDFCVGPGSALQGRGRGRGGQEAHWHRTQCNTSSQLKGEKLGSCMVCLHCLHTSTQGKDSLLWNPHRLPFSPGEKNNLQGAELAMPCLVTGCSSCLSSQVDVACQGDTSARPQATQAVVVSLLRWISGKHTGTLHLWN